MELNEGASASSSSDDGWGGFDDADESLKRWFARSCGMAELEEITPQQHDALLRNPYFEMFKTDVERVEETGAVIRRIGKLIREQVCPTSGDGDIVLSGALPGLYYLRLQLQADIKARAKSMMESGALVRHDERGELLKYFSKGMARMIARHHDCPRTFIENALRAAEQSFEAHHDDADRKLLIHGLLTAETARARFMEAALAEE